MSLASILLIDKPTGITSFDVIRQLRKRTGIRKMGHAGTLDPAASGLLIIGIGEGTKNLTELIKLDKVYEAEVVIGRSTTTGDREGDVLEEVKLPEISRSEISDVVTTLVGTHRLPVSAYSAIKKDGKPMYERAREAAKIGELIQDVPWRDMTVYAADVLEQKVSPVNRTNFLLLRVRFAVASGTYIRSLAEEIGRRLGYPASLLSLRRTRIGDFDVKNAKQIEDFN